MDWEPVNLEWWQHPFGIFTIVAIGFSVLLIIGVIIFIVRHPKGSLIFAGIIGVPILLYNYLDDIIRFFQGELGQRILWIAAAAGIALIAIKVIKVIRKEIELNRKVKAAKAYLERRRQQERFMQ